MTTFRRRQLRRRTAEARGGRRPRDGSDTGPRSRRYSGEQRRWRVIKPTFGAHRGHSAGHHRQQPGPRSAACERCCRTWCLAATAGSSTSAPTRCVPDSWTMPCTTPPRAACTRWSPDWPASSPDPGSPPTTVPCYVLTPSWPRSSGQAPPRLLQDRGPRSSHSDGGEPAEVAATVAFLATGTAAFITGQTIYVNGGASMG